MNLQTQILKKYRHAFPQDTLRTISEKTGIQHTRVFRIFNGSSMKLEEYEAFDKIIASKSNRGSCRNLYDLAERAISRLPIQSIDDLANILERRISLHELTHDSDRAGLHYTIIA